MANKTYNEFPAGSYDTNKIFLQADPITGALEKVNLPGQSSTKQYVAMFSQGGTSNPITTVIKDTIGITAFLWTATGVFLLESNSKFTDSKTSFQASVGHVGSDIAFMTMEWGSVDDLIIKTYTKTGALTNNCFDIFIQVEVFV